MTTETTGITIPISQHVTLKGNLNIPDEVRGLVIFAHGSGSSRFSPRNNFVARILNKQNFATLLTDLLTEMESDIYENRFNIDLLTERLSDITRYISNVPKFKDIPIGYFGASTGAAAALKSASKPGSTVKAIVSRGGRPDLVMSSLEWVKAPTLFIVGGFDEEIIRLNEKAYNRIQADKEMQIIENATHLFEETGKLELVAMIAGKWFAKHLHKQKTPHTVNINQ